MRLKKDDTKTYPKFKYYVSVNIPQVKSVASIMKAIEKHAGTIKTNKIKDALTWGKGPMIEVVDDLKSDGKKIYGLFQGKVDPEKLKVHKWLVDRFEGGKGLVTAPNGKLVYIVGVTILHELTHWADWKDGTDTKGEEGGKYEKDVYGGEVYDPDF